MNFQKLQLLEFRLNSMLENPAIVMIAKRGSGKSYITRDLIYHYRHIPAGAVISLTDRMDPFFKYFFPDLYIHYNLDEIIFQKILARQSTMLDKLEEKRKFGKKIDPSAILVMDDCLSKKGEWAKKEGIMEILMNGRHYRLTYLLTMQYPLGISPELRSNFDYIFLLKEDNVGNKKRLYDNYAGMFPSIAMFEKVFSQCTQDYKAMVIDNRAPANNIQEKVFWFKARDRKFSFGSRLFKDFHKKYYDPSYKKKKNLFVAAESFFKKKKNDVDIKIDLI